MAGEFENTESIRKNPWLPEVAKKGDYEGSPRESTREKQAGREEPEEEYKWGSREAELRSLFFFFSPSKIGKSSSILQLS